MSFDFEDPQPDNCPLHFQFTIALGNATDFDTSNNACLNELGGSLAVPTTREKLDTMKAALEVSSKPAVFVGLKTEFVLPQPEPSDYKAQFLNTLGIVENPFTSGLAGSVPWASGEPSTGDCVEMFIEEQDAKLRSKPCTETSGFMCEVSCDLGEVDPVDEGVLCVDNSEVFFVQTPENLVFDGVQFVCRTFGAIVPVLENQAKLTRVTNLGKDNVFVGFVDFFALDEVDETDTGRFIAVDSSDTSFIDVGQGVQPWKDGKPGGGRGSRDNCVAIKDEDLSDDNCDSKKEVICERNCAETNTPTTNPTQAPSLNPSLAPTLAVLQPTQSPTQTPTQQPTAGLDPPIEEAFLSNCLAESELFTSTVLLSFDQSVAFCESNNGNLIVPRDLSTFERITDFQKQLNNTAMFLGLKDPTNQQNIGDPSRFLDLGQQPVSFILVEEGSFPWNEGQPSEGNCIVVTQDSLESVSCPQLLNPVCTRECNEDLFSIVYLYAAGLTFLMMLICYAKLRYVNKRLSRVIALDDHEQFNVEGLIRDGTEGHLTPSISPATDNTQDTKPSLTPFILESAL